MSRGINKAIIVGNLGQDPDTKYTGSGNAITTISVATSESWVDKNSGEQKTETEWHRVVFYNKLAEIAGQYLKKGSKVYVEGKIKTRKWQDNDGHDRYSTEINAKEMQMLDSSSEGARACLGADGGQRAPTPPQKPKYAIEDDDIPFS